MTRDQRRIIAELTKAFNRGAERVEITRIRHPIVLGGIQLDSGLRTVMVTYYLDPRKPRRRSPRSR